MKRSVDLSEISDVRLYRSSDLVKLDTGGCTGCSACCHQMESTIVLDPYDMWRMYTMRAMTLEDLLDGHASLTVVDGLVLPVLSMTGEYEACTFLDGNGRCSIHDARPGICRLFPLGRNYEGGECRYLIQPKERARGKAEVRIRSWLDTPDLPLYEKYILDWHGFLEQMEHLLSEEDDTLRKAACIYILQVFYRVRWDPEREFYPQYHERMDAARRHFGFA